MILILNFAFDDDSRICEIDYFRFSFYEDIKYDSGRDSVLVLVMFHSVTIEDSGTTRSIILPLLL